MNRVQYEEALTKGIKKQTDKRCGQLLEDIYDTIKLMAIMYPNDTADDVRERIKNWCAFKAKDYGKIIEYWKEGNKQ